MDSTLPKEVEGNSGEVDKTRGFYRREGGISTLSAKEKKRLSQARSFPLGGKVKGFILQIAFFALQSGMQRPGGQTTSVVETRKFQTG